jgi:branched-chain amino acid transport system ATP-binding protein
MTVLLVEQNAMRALQVANRAYVIEAGKIRMSGTGGELLRNIDVRRAYLGG